MDVDPGAVGGMAAGMVDPETCETNLTFVGETGDNAHMRLRRLLIVCLVSFGSSLQGVAGVHAVEAPCPMMEGVAESAEDSVILGESSHDCCNDADTFAKTGKLCKTDLSCQSLSQAPQSGYALVLFAPTTEPAVPFPDRVIGTHDPAPVWRPPALI